MKTGLLILGIFVSILGAYPFMQGLAFLSSLIDAMPPGGPVHFSIIIALGILMIIAALKKPKAQFR